MSYRDETREFEMEKDRDRGKQQHVCKACRQIETSREIHKDEVKNNKIQKSRGRTDGYRKSQQGG